ncbi:putative UDP-N-acetylglucosamine transferase subunit ALG14 like protein [Blattamonas nauphoetae]|uniref:UDP-N-acetylglucosamine transferase subunit ALG14 n=1 Tax=Blattamonas nauphoetae TaxID=2049346 RepID=A0ABQ9XPS9_9EUKA|nr:putative UDP-N-acetylglucosamine transferase subunit ALG14 like protein [Blattamonas nauphoetae]
MKILILILLCLLVLRFFVVLPWNRLLRKKITLSPDTKKRASQRKAIIVLGSGGHTTEMLNLLTGIDLAQFTPRHYILSETDKISETKGHNFEESRGQNNSVFHRIPRSREVLQSYSSSIFTTIKSIFACIKLVITIRPDVVLTNGPGTGFPVCVAAWFLKFFWNRNLRIIFIESFCRVTSMSLTGKLLYYTPIADGIVVQWPELERKYPMSQNLGQLV